MRSFNRRSKPSCRRCQSSGWMSARTFSAVTPKSFLSTPKIPYCPSSQTHSPVLRFQSQEPMLPAASARLRRSSLCWSRIGRRLQFRRAGRHPLLQLGVHALELPGLAVELGEHPDLCAQHLRHDRDRHVVDRAHFVAAQTIHLGQMDRRDEDHRSLLEPRMLPDHRGELEAIEIGHADIHQDHRDFRFQEMRQRLPAGRRLEQVLAEIIEYDLVAHQLGRLIVDQQDVDLSPVPAFASPANDGATYAAPTEAARC